MDGEERVEELVVRREGFSVEEGFRAAVAREARCSERSGCGMRASMRRRSWTLEDKKRQKGS